LLLLDVIIIYPNNLKIKCGEIITGTPEGNGRIKGAFRYTPEYLQHPDAFPCEQTEPKLLEALGNSGMGALCFETGNAIKTPQDPSADILHLEQLLELAIRYDAGEQLSDQDFCSLAVCGSSPGGARPKSLIRDKDNFLWLAKFPKHNDHFHVEQIEAATLKLAENSGLKVPEFKILTVGSRKALLVKRFDVADDSGRYHMISMKTVLNAQYYAWYEDIFKAVKKYSTQPSVDIPALFRQMVFNAAIGNTDDHLKNFCMLHKETGYCLSPAFDLLPDIHGKRSHSLSFPKGSGEFSPNRSVLLAYAADLNIKNPDSIIDAVIQAVSAWQDVYAAYDVPDTDIQKLDQDISYRLDKLKN